MQFRELVLHNVGVYKGKQSIDLRTAAGRPVILIGGLNGCGKTTFLDALQMALYGRRARLSNRGAQSWEAFLRESINRSVAPEDGASIELTFQIDLEGVSRVYRVVRSWSVHGKSTKEFVTVFLDGQWDRPLSTGWAEHIEELLPLEIANLFFFDGEKIESLADPETASSVVRSAVHSLLGVGTLEQLRTDLVALQRRQTPPSNDASVNERVVTLETDRARLQTESDAVVQRLGEIEGRIRRARRHADEIEAEFAREGGSLYQRRKDLEIERARVAAEWQSTQEQLRAIAEGALPLALLSRELEDLREQSEAEAAVGDAVRLLKHVEERDDRILADLEESFRQHLAPVLAQDRASLADAAQAPIQLGLDAEMRAQLRALPSALDEARAASDKLMAKSADLEETKQHLDSQLAGVPTDDAIADLVHRRAEAQLGVARLEGEKLGLDDELKRLAQVVTSVEADLTKAEADRRESSIQTDYTRRVLEHADRVRLTLSTLRTRLIAQHIGKIEVATLEAFTTLMRKSGLVQDLVISKEDFSMQLVGAGGRSFRHLGLVQVNGNFWPSRSSGGLLVWQVTGSPP